jgi:hypothetical protein
MYFSSSPSISFPVSTLLHLADRGHFMLPPIDEIHEGIREVLVDDHLVRTIAV